MVVRVIGGDPLWSEVATPMSWQARQAWRESDRVVRALMLGNAGGAKDPDFRHAFEVGEVEVIGDEPGNTDKDPEPSEEAIR